jgi:hypothetical protein
MPASAPASAAFDRADPWSGPQSPSAPQPSRAQLLEALEAAHRQLESALADVRASTAEADTDRARFKATRFRIGQCEFDRRRLVQRICGSLLATASPAEAEVIGELRRRELEHARRASLLIARWTPQAMALDWESYRLDSYLLREEMRTALAIEKRILYPLLGSE